MIYFRLKLLSLLIFVILCFVMIDCDNTTITNNTNNIYLFCDNTITLVITITDNILNK